jgi:hypothetical protein
LCGGALQIWGGVAPRDLTDEDLAKVNRIAALHARVGLLEMVSHEFLDKGFRKERSTFADGTTVTIDLDAGTAKITPEL